MIDTLRMVLGWGCNLQCPYCCNNSIEILKQFRHVGLDDIEYWKYKYFCLTGGEPLLMMALLDDVTYAIYRRNSMAYLILNTNGILLDRKNAMELCDCGIDAVNVGLHEPDQFEEIIKRCMAACQGTGLALRFNVWESYSDEVKVRHPEANIKPWVMNACDRGNEDRVSLEEVP